MGFMNEDHITTYKDIVPDFISSMLQDFKARKVPLVAQTFSYERQSLLECESIRYFIGVIDKFTININNNPKRLVHYRTKKLNYLAINLPYDNPCLYSINFFPSKEVPQEHTFNLIMYKEHNGMSLNVIRNYIFFYPVDFHTASLTERDNRY